VKTATSFTWTVLPDGRRFWGTSGAQVRVNPNFASTEYRNFDLQSNYNALQTRLTKRFGAGLQLQASYTFAKAMDDGSEGQGDAVMDPTNPMADYGLSSYNVNHNFSFNGIYAVPAFANSSGVLHHLLGGWQVSGLLTLQTGLPLNVVEGFN